MEEKRKAKKSKLRVATYHVPKTIFDNAIDDIERKMQEKRIKNAKKTAELKCHTTKFQYFNTNEPAMSIQNLSEAMKQAFEDRNFHALYGIIQKALVIRNNFFTQQIFEYLIRAIEIDPKIEDRDTFLMNTVKGLKGFDKDTDALNFIKQMHLIERPETEKDKSADSESDDY